MHLMHNRGATATCNHPAEGPLVAGFAWASANRDGYFFALQRTEQQAAFKPAIQTPVPLRFALALVQSVRM